MVAWKRFPVPEFDRDAFKDMAYEAPPILSAAEAADLITKRDAGDASVYGAYAVIPDDALFDRFTIQGEHRHAIMCLLPDEPVHLLGRSWGWHIQRALILDSLDADSAEVTFEWRTPRPMNTRLGPEDGVTTNGGVAYVMTGNRYADHWIANRSIIQNDWEPGDGKSGFRLLAATDDELDDFHDCYLAFAWPAQG